MLRKLICRVFGHKYIWYYTFREDFCLRCGHVDTQTPDVCDHPEHLHGCPGDCWTRPHKPCPSGCTKMWNKQTEHLLPDE